jgi:hypothetical protein
MVQIVAPNQLGFSHERFPREIRWSLLNWWHFEDGKIKRLKSGGL